MVRGKSRDQRKHPRIESRFPIRSGTDSRDLLEMESVNLSLGGVYCTSRRFVPPMTKLQVTLHLPSLDGAGPEARDPIRAEAVVVRILPEEEERGRDRTYQVALFFSRMEREDRIHLATYLDLQKKAEP